MKRKICVILAVFCIAFSFVGLFGCNNGVSGTYIATFDSSTEVPFKATLKLKNNGSCTLVRTYSGSVVDGDYWGTYTVDGNTLNMHLNWEDFEQREGDYDATILNNGNIRMLFFGKTLTYYKS